MENLARETVVDLQKYRPTTITGRAGDFGKRVFDSLGSASDAVSKGAVHLARRTKFAAGSTHTLVKGNPWQAAAAVGIAAFAAFYLVSRASRSYRMTREGAADAADTGDTLHD